MKRCFWTGSAVSELYLRGKHCDFLLQLLARCGTIYTAAGAVTEFHLSVAKAANQGKMKAGGSAALRAAFDRAVQDGRIVLLPDDATAPVDELIQRDLRKHLSQLDSSTVAQLATAKEHQFRYIVILDEKLVPVCRIWGLRPVTPDTAVDDEVEATYVNELARIEHLYSRMQYFCDRLCEMREQMKAATETLLQSGPDPVEQAAQIESINTAQEEFFDLVDEIQGDLTSAELLHANWENAAKELGEKPGGKLDTGRGDAGT